VLDRVENNWIYFKKFGSLPENFSPCQISMTGSGLGQISTIVFNEAKT